MTGKQVLASLPAAFGDEYPAASLRRYGHEARELRDLLVQMICLSRRRGADGFVAEEDLGALVYPDPPRVAQRDVRRLIEAGCVEKAVGGYHVPLYLAGNRAARPGAVAGKAEGARRANHERWHANRGSFDPRCEYCHPADLFTDQYSDQSTDKYSNQSTDAFTDQYSDPERISSDFGAGTEPFRGTPVPPTGELPPLPGCPAHPLRRHGNCRACGTSGRTESADPAASDDPRFTEFWNAYPRKVGKPRARKAWRAAMRRKDDPEVIIRAAIAYRDDPARKPDFTAHPSTWLNDERYNDGPPEDPASYPDDIWES